MLDGKSSDYPQSVGCVVFAQVRATFNRIRRYHEGA